jgi:hypothetical protein
MLYLNVVAGNHTEFLEFRAFAGFDTDNVRYVPLLDIDFSKIRGLSRGKNMFVFVGTAHERIDYTAITEYLRLEGIYYYHERRLDYV